MVEFHLLNKKFLYPNYEKLNSLTATGHQNQVLFQNIEHFQNGVAQ